MNRIKKSHGLTIIGFIGLNIHLSSISWWIFLVAIIVGFVED